MFSTNCSLEETRHDYPFLAEHAFDYRNGEFDPTVLQIIIAEYIDRHIRRDVVRKGGSATETLASVTKKLVAGCKEGTDIFGTQDALSDEVVGKLECGDAVKLPVPLTGVLLSLKRFGTCLGMQVLDNGGKTHVNATEILEEIAHESPFQRFRRFVFSRGVVMSRRWAYRNNEIDIDCELTSAARYAPDVEWRSPTYAAEIADALVEDYINKDHRDGSVGVEIGRCYGISVCANVLFGAKERDRAWRRGSVTRKKGTLEFEPNSHENSLIRYAIRIADDNNIFQKVREGINYMPEQCCHDQLIQTLFNAFSARHTAEFIVVNPHFVDWKEKKFTEQSRSARR